MNQSEYYIHKLEYETDAWDLKEAIDNDENIVIIDARSESSFVHEHIKKALNLPHGLITEDTLRKLDQNATYVVYCSGTGCNASTKGALILAQFGLKVKELIGGLQWWKQYGYPTEGLLSDIKSEEICDC